MDVDAGNESRGGEAEETAVVLVVFSVVVGTSVLESAMTGDVDVGVVVEVDAVETEGMK